MGDPVGPLIDIFTNVALTGDGDIWCQGMENEPAEATTWKGARRSPSIGDSLPRSMRDELEALKQRLSA